MSWMMSFFEMTDGGINQFHLTYYNTFTFKTFTFFTSQNIQRFLQHYYNPSVTFK